MANTFLQPTDADWQTLLNGNPLAAAELKAIILARLLAEKEAELASIKTDDNVTDINEAAGD
tara:strand:- start:53 stop:238 length:186 start_codon:yes stop_codon:yes gene_type:complete